ncbi:MAG TPA: membrane dipeptidase [Myxococcales bacterium]|nr:membrane dipeptidase [Myxococcales bacterium]
MLTRRQLVAALATAPIAARVRAQTTNYPPYRGAIVVDALGGPGDPDQADPAAPLSARALADAKASGITLCNQTVAVGGDSWDEALRGFAFWQRELDAHPDAFVKVTRGAHIAQAQGSGRMGLVFGVQGLSYIGEDLARLDTLHDLGLRIAQLTYNVRALTGDGCLEPGNAGISRFGRRLIEHAEERRMIIDLSHGGRRTIAEAVAAAKMPFITHTGCAALVDHPRNVPDEILRAVAQKGGVVGIYFMPFLRPAGQQHLDDVVRHIEHAVNAAGEDHVGIGTDGVISTVVVDDKYRKAFAEQVQRRRKLGISAPGEVEDVYTFVPELNDPRRLETLGAALAKRGFSDARVLKILGGNFARGFAEALG